MFAIDYPTFEVGGRTLIVRYSLAARVLLKRRYAIDPNELGAALDAANPDKSENLVKLFAACVAENFLDAERPAEFSFHSAPTSDYWLSQIDMHMIPDVDKVIGVAMGKARETLEKRATASLIPIAS